MGSEFDLVKALLGLTLIGASWVLWLLLFLSVLSIAIILERFVFFYRIRFNFSLFRQQLLDSLKENDYKQIENLCNQVPSPFAKVVLNGLKNRQKGIEAMQGSMEGKVVEEKSRMDRGLIVLGTLGNNAPFIGLFGTVIGIIKAFHDLASNPQGGPSVIMSGISEALVATAIGLLVAIPAVIAFNTFSKVMKNHLANAQAVIKLLLTHHQ